MAHVIVTEKLYNEAFIAEQTEDFEAYIESLEACTPECAEEISGVPAEDIRQAARLYAKAEQLNMTGSIKDRMALHIIQEGYVRGLLHPGSPIVEATSGNTGIGLAMVCARKGYPLVVTMAESFSIERRKMLRFLGAKVVLTPASEKGTGMLNKAIELSEKHGWYLCRQFENQANADIHSKTTAQEMRSSPA